MKACFCSTDILLPNHLDIGKWAVVACDQYTSQEDYWKNVEKIVGNEPSTLHIIFPEVYLEKDTERITNINQTMKKYMNEQVLTQSIHDGFVLVERDTESGTRLGLVGAIDLDAYDYTPGANAYIKATEGTIQERIPPRLKIRENAILEAPHVMVLIDDPQFQLIEELYKQKDQLKCLYDTDLMLNGGHIKGYAIEDELAKKTNELLYQMQEDSQGFFLAVGDGNHSLATAKTYWENIKKTLTDEEKVNHPARYAMVELVNLHSPALIFEPIHRVLFNVNFVDMLEQFKKNLIAQDISFVEGHDIVFTTHDETFGFSLIHNDDRLPVDILQKFLDDYLTSHPQTEIDYVHGDDALETLGQQDGNCGIRLDAIDKSSLFPAIKAGGVLPRKTFSMGEAHEKRYYIECRCITK